MNHFLCRMAVIFSACSVPWDGEVGEMRKNPRWKAEESVGRAGGEQHLFKALVSHPFSVLFLPR